MTVVSPVSQLQIMVNAVVLGAACDIQLFLHQKLTDFDASSTSVK